MAKEQRILFDAKDLLGVRVRCNRTCEGEAFYPLQEELASSDGCPLCAKPWKDTDGTVFRVLRMLRKLPHQGEGEIGVHFELDASAADATT